MQILWLVSSYPNPYETTNGDFVERHALAVSKIVPLDLIHVVQIGKDRRTKQGYMHTKQDNLRELVYSFPFRKWHLGILDKIRYNIKYRIYYRMILFKYIRQYGTPELIHLHVPMKAGILAKDFAEYWQIPYIVTEHSSMYDPVAKDSFFTRSIFFKYYTKKIFKDAAAVTNVSAAMGKMVQELFKLQEPEIIHNVVDTTVFKYKPTVSTTFTWFHASTMFALKNVDKIIDAFTELTKLNQDWELIIAGNATSNILDKVCEAGLSNKIKFIGELKHNDVAKQMQQSSALVMFSKHENFPCVIIEALCCGLPVVSSNVGGIAEAVNETNGLLVESENVAQLTKALAAMMANYHQYNRENIAREAALKYSEETIGDQFVYLYKKILG